MDFYNNSDPASYIEGVPVKISEKFKPPPKISVSSSLNCSVNLELLTFEHDFKFEEGCINWINNYKEQKQKLKLESDARLAAYELAKQEELMKMKEEEEEMLNKMKEQEKLSEEETELNNCDEEGDEMLDSNSSAKATSVALKDDDDIENSNNHNESEEAAGSLDPSQYELPATSFQNPLISESATGSGEKFIQPTMLYNTGKTINASLHGSAQVNMQSGQCSVLIPTQVKPTLPNEQANSQKMNINIAEFETAASDPFDTAALNSINDMEELAKVLEATNNPPQSTDKMPKPSYNYHDQTYGLNGMPATPYPYYNGVSQTPYNVPYAPLAQNTAFSGQKNVHGQVYGTSYAAVSQPSTHTQNKYHHTQAPSAMQYGTSANSNIGSNHLYRVPNQIQSPAPYKRQDLEDFYSKYYSNQKPESNGSRSGDTTPNNGLRNCLRSSASVPDLTLNDEEVSSINKRRSSPLLSDVRPSSTGLQNYQENFCGQVCKSINSQQIHLPDPFGELNPDAQILVQNVSEMGFPRPRVARAVQKLGTDHKKLIEVLLALQDFQENGESQYTSEVAFYYYMGDLEKVKQFLPTTKQLVNLGFSEGKVVDALLKTDNDCTKALEQLVA